MAESELTATYRRGRFTCSCLRIKALYSHDRRALRLFVNGVEQDPATYNNGVIELQGSAEVTVMSVGAEQFADGSAVRFRADTGKVNELFGYRVGARPTAVTYAAASSPPGLTFTRMRGGAERSRLASDRVTALAQAGDRGGIERLGERGNEEERYWARFAIRTVDKQHAEEARATLASIRDEWDNLPDAEPVGIVRRP